MLTQESIVRFWRQLDDIRRDKGNARDLSFRQFLTETAQAANDTTGELTPARCIQALGLDPHTVRFDKLMAHSEAGYCIALEIARQAIDRGLRGATLRQELNQQRALEAVFSQATILTDPTNRFINPEYFTPWINRGVVQGQYWDALIASDITVPQPTTTMPLLSISDAALEERAEGGSTKEGSVTYGSKQVTIKNRSKAIYLTDESIWFNSIQFVSVFLEDLGRLLAAGLNGEAVRVLRDGDQTNGSEAATVIGVQTAGTFAYRDATRVAMRMGMIGKPITQVLANEESAIEWEELPEVKNNQNSGNVLMPSRTRFLQRPKEWEVFPAFNIPNNKFLFNNPDMAMVALTAKPLTLENVRVAERKLNGVIADIFKGFAIMHAIARIIVDKSILFSANGWTAGFNTQYETW